MSTHPDVKDNIRRLLKSFSQEEQLSIRKGIMDNDYYHHIRNIYLNNPFLKLTDDEIGHFRQTAPDDLMVQLMLMRDLASKSRAPKISVFCMPKSGSSFVQSAIKSALEIPHVSMTGFASPGQSSYFGMNSREQELDELAIVKSILNSTRGFVSQNHTKCSLYLSLQLAFYGIFSIVTIRNILDCIVSFDDMMISWRHGKDEYGWLNDAQFHLPIDYPELEDQVRYDILAKSFGIWLIGFYLTWKRIIGMNRINPMILKYEEDILDTPRLIEKVTSRIRMTPAQKARFEQYAIQPDAKRARLNVGVQGRGQKIDPEIVEFLLHYARRFSSELTEEEIRYLIR